MEADPVAVKLLVSKIISETDPGATKVSLKMLTDFVA